MATTFSLSADCKTMEIHGAPASASFTLYHNELTSPTQLYQLEDPTAPYNGTIDPNDAIREAATILRNQLVIFVDLEAPPPVDIQSNNFNTFSVPEPSVALFKAPKPALPVVAVAPGILAES